MKIFKVTVEIYKYWYSEDRGGWVAKNRYFSTLEKAEDFANYFTKNHLWLDNYGKLTSTEDARNYPTVKIEEIEIDDTSNLF